MPRTTEKTFTRGVLFHLIGAIGIAWSYQRQTIDMLKKKTENYAERFWGESRVCANCGIVSFMGPGSITGVMTFETPNVRELRVVVAMPHVETMVKHVQGTIFRVCKDCEKDARRASFVIDRGVDYWTKLLAIPFDIGIDFALVSIPKTAFYPSQWMHNPRLFQGTRQNITATSSRFFGPLVREHPTTTVEDQHRTTIEELLGELGRTNVFVQHFFSNIEKSVQTYPVTSENVVRNITERTKRRKATSTTAFDALVVPLDWGARTDLAGVSQGLLNDPSNVVQRRVVDVPRAIREEAPVEALLFPHLFPDGSGFFDDSLLTFQQYCKLRMNQFGNPLTLSSFYVLMLGQLFMKQVLALALKYELRYSASTATFNRMAQAKQMDQLRELMNSPSTSTVAGTPKFWYSQYNRLCAMTAKYGVASFFLTITCKLTWPEFEAMKRGVEGSYGGSMDWHWFPTEVISLFHERLNAFLAGYVYGAESSNIFGRVQHHYVRIEFQGNGLPHAHILLWVHPDDFTAANDRIIGFVPTGSDELSSNIASHINRWQRHRCRDGCFTGHGEFARKCKYGFPKAPHVGPAVKSADGARWIYPRTETSGDVAECHPLVWLALDGCHAHCTALTEDHYERYCTKYVAKCEPYDVLSLEETEGIAFGLPSGLSRAERLAIGNIFNARVVGAPEMVFQSNSQSTLVRTDCKFKLLDTSAPRNWPGYFKRAANINSHPSLLYLNRPRTPEFDDLHFVEYFENYDVVISAHAIPRGTYWTDGLGHYVTPTKTETVVHFFGRKPQVQFAENFYFHLLLLSIPWKDLTHPRQMLEDGHPTYMIECYERGLMTVSNISNMLKSCARRFGWDRDDVKFMVDTALQRDLATLEEEDLHAPNHDEEEEIDDLTLDHILQPQFVVWTAEELATKISRLSPSQKDAFDGIRAEDNGYIRLEGEGGTGKTRLLETLIQAYTIESKTVAICASTGAAAAKLGMGAFTVHSLFNLTTSNVLTSMSATNDNAKLLRFCDVIVVDEVSMLHKNVFGWIQERLRLILTDASMAIQQPGFGKRIILTADFGQLGAVCHSRKCERQACTHQLTNLPQFVQIPKFELVENFRFQDQVLAQHIHAFRETPIPNDTVEYFRQKQIPEDDPILQTNAVVIGYENNCIQKHNLHVMQHLYPAEEITTYEAVDKHTPHTATEQRDIVLLQYAEKSSNLVRTLKLAPGVPVMITQNINVRNGLANGSRGVVQQCENDIVRVRMTSTGRLVPFKTTSCLTRAYRSRYSFCRQQFPLRMCFGITIYRAQGSEFTGHVVVDVRKFPKNDKNMLYTALSRAIHGDNLHILGDIGNLGFTFL